MFSLHEEKFSKSTKRLTFNNPLTLIFLIVNISNVSLANSSTKFSMLILLF